MRPGTRYSAISAGPSHYLALTTDDSVIAWGEGRDGQVNVPPGLNGVVALAAGGSHSLALKRDGTVVSWGHDPTFPAGLTNIVQIDAGRYNSLALKADGSTVSWGLVYSGDSRNPFVPVIAPAFQDIAAISAGYVHNLALRADGTVAAWFVRPQTPAHLNFGQTNVPVDLTNVVAIAAGPTHSLALERDGTVVGWGHEAGQPPAGLSNVVAIAAGGHISGGLESRDYGITARGLALKADGTVVRWGNGTQYSWEPATNLTNIVAIDAYDKQVIALKSDGIISTFGEDYLRPIGLPPEAANVIAVSGRYIGNGILFLTADGKVKDLGSHPKMPIPDDLTGVVAISTGYRHDLALMNDGTVVAWGVTNQSIASVTNVPPGLTNVVSIAAGEKHNLALRQDGTVVAWGDNTFRQTNVPVGLSGVIAISAGSHHNVALKGDGTVVAWGLNGSWSYDDDRFGQATVPEGLTNVIAIAAGQAHNLALKGDGTVIAWGSNVYGESTVPAALRDVVAIAAGPSHGPSLALKADGEIVGWGWGYSASWNLPPPGLQNVISISAGYSQSFAIVEPPVREQPLELRIEVHGSEAVISWTSENAGWQLETAQNLSPVTEWEILPEVASGAEASYRWTNSLPSNTASQFFRLKR